MNFFKIYSLFPVFIQNILCSIKGYKLERERYGGEYKELFESLKKSDDWNEDEIIKYKEQQISQILKYAYEHTKFYRRFFDQYGVKPEDFKCLNDLSKFPILTKELVRENWEDMISDEFKRKDLIAYHTSGSTGKALDFFWTKHSLRYYWAVVWRGRDRFGVKKGDLHINFTGKIVVPISQTKPPYWRYNRPLNQYMLNMQHITQDKIKDIVEFINRKKARFFVGYPSIIHSFAMLVEETGLTIKNPPLYIFSSAEKMYDFQREVIERVFKGVKIIEHYGFSENAASASKNTGGLYQVDYELGHMELKTPVMHDGFLTGEILATGFQNLGMPFIRYEIGDTATFISNNIISDIEGRNGDFVITPEGAKVMRFGYIFKCTREIKECQIAQKKEGEMIVRAILRQGADINGLENDIRAAVKEWISPTIKVLFEYVDAIPRTKAGKFKAVVSELP